MRCLFWRWLVNWRGVSDTCRQLAGICAKFVEAWNRTLPDVFLCIFCLPDTRTRPEHNLTSQHLWVDVSEPGTRSKSGRLSADRCGWDRLFGGGSLAVLPLCVQHLLQHFRLKVAGAELTAANRTSAPVLTFFCVETYCVRRQLNSGAVARCLQGVVIQCWRWCSWLSSLSAVFKFPLFMYLHQLVIKRLLGGDHEADHPLCSVQCYQLPEPGPAFRFHYPVACFWTPLWRCEGVVHSLASWFLQISSPKMSFIELL